MIAAVVISSLIVILVGMLLLARIVFCIDTKNGVFYASVGRVFRFDLEWAEFIPQPVIRVFWWNWRPGLWNSAERKQPEKKQKKERQRSSLPAGQLKRVIRILKSFHLRRFELDLDTDDHVLNAQLYPLNHIVQSERVRININWRHENHLLLVLESRIIRTLYQMIRKTS